MPSRPRKAAPEQTALLTAAFPARLQAEAAHIAEEIRPSVMCGGGLTVTCRTNHWRCPIAFSTGVAIPGSKLDEPQALIYACIQSRHHDGHVRQYQLSGWLGRPSLGLCRSWCSSAANRSWKSCRTSRRACPYWTSTSMERFFEAIRPFWIWRSNA